MFQSFDLEIAKEIPEGTADWKTLAPLGISCAAAWNGVDCVEFYDSPQMSPRHACDMLDWMLAQDAAGHQFLTWNGTSFDFQVAAQETGRFRDCVSLCLKHIDLMLIATIFKGWYVSLDSALLAHGIESKQHRVQLKDGNWIDDMSGSMAPKLWAAGETQAVLDYLRGDVMRPLALLESVRKKSMLSFVSSTGRVHSICLPPRIPNVFEILQRPMADNTWMGEEASRPTKKRFYEWMLPHLTQSERSLIVNSPAMLPPARPGRWSSLAMQGPMK